MPGVCWCCLRSSSQLLELRFRNRAPRYIYTTSCDQFSYSHFFFEKAQSKRCYFLRKRYMFCEWSSFAEWIECNIVSREPGFVRMKYVTFLAMNLMNGIPGIFRNLDFFRGRGQGEKQKGDSGGEVVYFRMRVRDWLEGTKKISLEKGLKQVEAIHLK